MSFSPKIKPEEVEVLHTAEFNGPVKVVNEIDNLYYEAVNYLNTQKIIGFDTETKPSFTATTKIIKVGAAVNDDIKSLQVHTKFIARGFVDLQTIASGWGIMDKSVRKMAAIILGIRVSKSQQLSNWETAELSPAQINYAAIDAWICLKMYLKLLSTPKPD